jgi:hypothetical protein
MKHYIGTICEKNGDMEYSNQYLFVTRKIPEKHADQVAMKWRGSNKSDWDNLVDGYWSDNTVVSDGGFKEIPKEDFEVLSKYLAIL